ncbi:MAG TPA: C39 family peptidase [Rhodocyclaceae bacterium]|nr:C39 family peptidase [Rhodocyclaceae bacterium]
MQAGGAFHVPVASLKETHFQRTVHQQYDYSCGSAALATLLTYHYSYPVSEQETFSAMFARGDQAKIKKEGFSLLDIKNYLAAHNFQADGYVADVDKLVVARIPAIALIKERGYQHFIVVKGVRNGRVLIGDPATGTRAMPESKFRKLWVNQVLFVVRNKQEVARFNDDLDWRAAPHAPLGSGVYGNGANLGLDKHGPADF